MIGQTIGKYRVVSRLGRGGMGTVYKAVDETLGREVAIKSLHPDLADSEVLKRFRAEAVTLARLNHPNIATLYDLTEHEGELLMVMEFVNGETFDTRSERAGPMPIPRASELCLQVLDALAHAHRAGIVHRDLKPANLMLSQSGLVKVMDFGIARMAGTEHLTSDGRMMGTPAYMAPEQVLGQEVDGRADLYAIGVVFYRLLTGALPFTAETDVAMAQKQISGAPTPVRRLRPDIQPECEEILAKALAKSPGDRYQTADEFKSALAPLTAGSVQVAATPRASKRTPVAAIAAAVLLAAVALPSVWLWKKPPAVVARVDPAAVAVVGSATVGPGAPVPAKNAIAPRTFRDVKLLVIDANRKTREQDATLRLGPDALQVLDGTRALASVPYTGIVAVFHSHSKEPRWAAPDGTPVPVAKVGGKFSFLKGDADWITVRTKARFIPIRAKEGAVARMIADIEDRTGVRVTSVAR